MFKVIWSHSGAGYTFGTIFGNSVSNMARGGAKWRKHFGPGSKCRSHTEYFKYSGSFSLISRKRLVVKQYGPTVGAIESFIYLKAYSHSDVVRFIFFNF